MHQTHKSYSSLISTVTILQIYLTLFLIPRAKCIQWVEYRAFQAPQTNSFGYINNDCPRREQLQICHLSKQTLKIYTYNTVSDESILLGKQTGDISWARPPQIPKEPKGERRVYTYAQGKQRKMFEGGQATAGMCAAKPARLIIQRAVDPVCVSVWSQKQHGKKK